MNKAAFIIFVLSDGTGETVEKMVRACLIQYQSKDIKVVRYKSIRSKDQVDAIIEEAQRISAVIVYTAVSEVVRDAIAVGVRRLNLMAVDLLGPTMDLLSKFLHEAPMLTPGLLHQVNEEYFKRIDAMEFTVKHDDGAHHENLHRADIVLVGVSRTSKTPLSIYLSHKGWKVANIPLVTGIEPPKKLFEVDQGKIMALTIDPEALTKIRRERLVRMGRDPSGDYASLQKVREEVEWARQIFSRNRRWLVLDVTNKALEETASEIEKVVNIRFRS